MNGRTTYRLKLTVRQVATFFTSKLGLKSPPPHHRLSLLIRAKSAEFYWKSPRKLLEIFGDKKWLFL